MPGWYHAEKLASLIVLYRSQDLRISALPRVLRAHTNILEVMHKVILAKLVKIYESKLSFFLKVSLQTTSGKEKEYVYIELKYMSHYFERSDEDSTIDLASLLKL